MQFENAHGTYQFPIILQSVTPGTVTFTRDFNIYNCRYLYLLDLTFRTHGDSIHFETCHNILLRNVDADGDMAAQETLKVNQCSMFFVESCTFTGAYENNLDYVAVQSGHVLNSRFARAGDWCVYVKGGSSYIRLHGNTISNCDTGGFTAGQGSGFEFSTPPYFYYEATDIKFTNNVISETVGACFGCNGCAYSLFAYNNCTRTGSRSHLIEVTAGGRNCDGNTAACTSRSNAGGWGPPSHIENGGNDGGEFIPCRHVYIFNNRLINPSGFQSQWVATPDGARTRNDVARYDEGTKSGSL